jgi:hypothetical protein
MSKPNLSIVAFIAACVALHAAGCTVVGFTLGVVADKGRPDYDTLHVWQVAELGEGDSVSISCDRNPSVKGVYLGADKTPYEQYKTTYAAWKMDDSAGQLLPSLDDTVVVERTSPLRRDVVGTLLGFDPGVICVLNDNDIEMVGVGDVRKLSSYQRKVISGETLKKLLGHGQVPFMSRLCVDVGADTLRLPLYEVSEIQKTNVKNQSWKGLLAGVAADVLIFVGLRVSLSGGFMGGK